MRIVLRADYPDRIAEAIEKSEFPVTSGVILGEGFSNGLSCRNCPPKPSPARTSIFIFQVQRAEGVIVIWDGKDRELIDLALSFELPVYVHYVTENYVVGMRNNWDDF